MNRVLVVLPNWYGETLFATPFLRALHQQCRGVVIATLGPPRCRDILLHNPHVDELIDYDEHGSQHDLLGKLRFIRTLRRGRFDTAFILRQSLTRSLLVALAGIPTRIGFSNRKSGWLLTHRVAPSKMAIHKAASYLPLLTAMGLSPVVHAYDYTVSSAERQEARAWWRTEGLGRDRPVVIVHPGANWTHKRWAPDRFAMLADHLTETTGAQIVITGGPEDLDLAAMIQRQMCQAAIILAGQTSLRQLAACLEQADLIVSNDTGVLHIAAALRRPLIALFGPTSPAITGPLGDPNCMTVLHHADCCPQVPCYQPNRPPHLGMNAISVEETVSAAEQLLQAARSDGREARSREDG